MSLWNQTLQSANLIPLAPEAQFSLGKKIFNGGYVIFYFLGFLENSEMYFYVNLNFYAKIKYSMIIFEYLKKSC
jgi:hypothetical protein